MKTCGWPHLLLFCLHVPCSAFHRQLGRSRALLRHALPQQALPHAQRLRLQQTLAVTSGQKVTLFTNQVLLLCVSCSAFRRQLGGFSVVLMHALSQHAPPHALRLRLLHPGMPFCSVTPTLWPIQDSKYQLQCRICFRARAMRETSEPTLGSPGRGRSPTRRVSTTKVFSYR